MEDGVSLCVAVYESQEKAKEDFHAVHELYATGDLKTYDAAIVEKSDNGKVHIMMRETPSQAGALGGAAVGALISILFPPGIVAFGVAGGALGGLIGHLWRGMSRSDVKELGEVLDEGDSALVLVSESGKETEIENTVTKASNRVMREIKADREEFERVLREAEKEWSEHHALG